MSIKTEGMENVEAWKGAVLLPVGRNDVIIESADETQSRAGHDQVEILFVSESGAGEIRDWLTFSTASPEAWQQSLGRARMFLDAIGLPPEDEFPTAKLPGKRLSIYVAEEPKFDDPTRMVKKVKAFEPIRGAASADFSVGTANKDDEIPF